ncbi:putative ComK family protein [Staphylococcus piscifermentans]|uniref:Competence protein ComK n=1 Tax=Staphylococcus piscifermentans TaxID=70258 RepID=A0A239UAG4_9STAP|nr:competence protein ComK [Staphylococcus piscifermentans]GEP85287.1 competence protein ComK [Staphylococcus piscifermentans]SNV06629.1 putative ComK family protein [Staphylococcus piscifermentans]
MTMEEHYIFKRNDIAIMPIIMEGEPYPLTQILSYEKEPRILKISPRKSLEKSCKFYGSKFSILRSDTIRLTDIKSKPPILLSPIISIILFSTQSISSPSNIWINIEYVKDIKAIGTKETQINFIDGQSITAPVTSRTINHQYKNAIYYEHLINKRVKTIKWNTEKPIDYSKPSLDVYETLCKYLVINQSNKS